jgi:hypothetical protein
MDIHNALVLSVVERELISGCNDSSRDEDDLRQHLARLTKLPSGAYYR